MLLCAVTNITPTVELNALAMKRGEPAVYKSLDTKPQQPYPPPSLDFRGMFNQRSGQGLVYGLSAVTHRYLFCQMLFFLLFNHLVTL